MKALIISALTGIAVISSAAALAGRDPSMDYQVNRAIAAKQAQQLAEAKRAQQGLAGPTGPAGKAGPGATAKPATSLIGHPTTRTF